MSEEEAPHYTAEELAIEVRVEAEAQAEGRHADFAEVLMAFVENEERKARWSCTSNSL